MVAVSRKDISTEELIEFPSESRFIKLPINDYLDLLQIEPVPAQVAVINAINNPKYRFVVAALSRRQGKTYIANIIGQLVSLVPGCNILIMSPNYSLSQISFELQRGLIKHFDLEVSRDNAKDKVIELTNSSTIRMGSINQVDSCVGRSYDLIIFDEAAIAKGMEAFNVSLRPTLDKENSKAIFISTPRGKNNWFSELYNRGYDDDFPEWVSIKATWKDNPRVSVKDIDEARKTTSDAEFRQEYEADFNVFEGQIWRFDSSQCVEDLSYIDFTRFDVIGGLDVGFRDPTAFVIVAYDDDEDMWYILDEYEDSEKTTEEQAVRIKELSDKYDPDFIFIDAAAAQTRYDFAQNYDISSSPAKKSLPDGISFIQNIVEKKKLRVDPKCKKVLYALDQYQWDPNPNLIKEKPKHDSASHMADAMRYAIYSYSNSRTGF